MKRKTLTRNLKRVIERIQTLDLPLIVHSLFIHGSYIRGDEEPGDLDLFLTYSRREDFDHFSEAFRNLRDIDELDEYYNKNIMLRKVAIGPLRSNIEKMGIPGDWLSTYNWAQLYGRKAPYLAFRFWPTTIAKRLLSKGMKGVHIEIASESGFSHIFDNLYTYQNLVVYRLWNENDSKRINLEPNKEEYNKYLELEHKNLSSQLEKNKLLVVALSYLLNESLEYISNDKYNKINDYLINYINKSFNLDDLLTQILVDFNIKKGIKSSFNYHKIGQIIYNVNQNDNKRLREDLKNLTYRNIILPALWHIILEYLNDNELISIIESVKKYFSRNIDEEYLKNYNKDPIQLDYSYYLRKPFTEMGLMMERHWKTYE